MSTTWTFGPNGVYTASWSPGPPTPVLTVTLTASGAALETFTGEVASQAIAQAAVNALGMTTSALLTQPVPAAVAATMPRGGANAASGSPNSGTVYMTSLPLAAGITTSKCTMATNTTAKTGGTHGWYVLTDANMKVVAVTADQTDSGTVWGTASTFYPLSWTAPFTVPATALYYVGVMVAQSAGTNPTFTTGGNVAANVAPAVGISPAIVLCGSSSTSQTTPPALGASLTALTGALNYNLYAYLE